MYSGDKKEIEGIDDPDNQQELEVSSEGIEGKEDDDVEDNQKRYHLRQRKTVVPYQAPLERPRQRKILFPSSGKRPNSLRRAAHRANSTSSSSSDEDEGVERRRMHSRNGTKRCSPVNFREDELKGVRKDRMKLGKSLADVEPMQIDSSVRFDAVGGLSDHISALKEMVVFPLLYPEVFEKFKIQPPRGCLFYGPPGTGKTLVARALANECSQGSRRVAFFMQKGADCLNKWVGESEKQLRLLFDQAYQMRPSIIFFDEIDGLAPVRSSKQDQVHSSIVSTLLALMDGLDSRGEVVVIGATNRLDSIDPALRRPGRFDREFLFGLPNKEARKEIFKIHTRDWTPKLLDTFIDELATECIGYCGADIKSLCAEASLCALRRRYPQIYLSSEKLQLDVNSIEINARDFALAMQKITPASQRAVPSPGRALSPIMQPLLGNTLLDIFQAIQRVFPHAELALKKDQQQGSLNSILSGDAIDRGDELPSIFEGEVTHKINCRPQGKFLDFSRKAYWQPTSCRPHLLLVGKAEYGQTSHLAPAVLHALEMFPVHTLDMAALFVSVSSPEETCAQLIREAQRTAPSIIYMPRIHLWWDNVGATLKATFTSLIQNIPSFAPVLLLATADVCHTDLPDEVQALFDSDFGEVFHVQPPEKEERRTFFEDLLLNQAAKPPASKKRAAGQTLEALPVVPPPERPPLTEEEMNALEEQEEDTLRELRIFLRDVTHRLATDRRFRAFTKPVDPEEVPDYDTVIKQPMDLSTVLSKIDLHQYLTAGDFLKDIDLICSNALEYNPDKDPGDRLVRHRACSLKDTAYSIVKGEIDEDFEQLCEEIKASRKKRGCISSRYAPAFYTVGKENSAPGCQKTDTKGSEKTKMTVAPVDASTPLSNDASKRKRRRNKCSSSTAAKRKRSVQFNKENKVPRDDLNESDGEDFPANCISNKDQTEFQSSQDSIREESENVLQEQQTNSNEREGGLFDMDAPAVDKERQMNDEKVMDIVTQSAAVVMVDCRELLQLLDMVTELTEGADIFRFEKLYARISQCIYQHREDYDKSALLKVLKKEIKALAPV
ncbi:ATPase family AAA domain-containing protein 2-like isoform X1 [Excalfactoria chinensis]|uniref:ATPase family AAA domain-containing protein 2-like isoform X1 n=1 Tax=Excalfactoria chinensis TaxID=46218 RepID=UPI003B3A3FDE